MKEWDLGLSRLRFTARVSTAFVHHVLSDDVCFGTFEEMLLLSGKLWTIQYCLCAIPVTAMETTTQDDTGADIQLAH